MRSIQLFWCFVWAAGSITWKRQLFDSRSPYTQGMIIFVVTFVFLPSLPLLLFVSTEWVFKPLMNHMLTIRYVTTSVFVLFQSPMNRMFTIRYGYLVLFAPLFDNLVI